VSELEQEIGAFRESADRLREEIRSVIVGHETAVEEILTCVFAGGHALLEGVPGLGKTLLVGTLARCLSLSFGRVQCTPDLMPADILGTTMIRETPDGRREMRFEEGPVFTNVLLADEVNRATPKTQSALLEAMQEGAATVGGVRRELPSPFLLLATRNPIEMEGTYPLPEAQLDRFLFLVKLESPDVPEIVEVLRRTTGEETAAPAAVLSAEEVLAARRLVRRVVLPDEVAEHAARIVRATHPGAEGAIGSAERYLRYGASPRGAQALALAGRVAALRDGRVNVSFDDVRRAARPALRHRLILTFEAEADAVDPDALVDEVLETVKRP